MRELLICSYLEPEHIARIRQVSPDVTVRFYPELLAKPRYEADHVGAPLTRSAAQEREWLELLGRAEILFDFDYQHVGNFKQHATSGRWLQASSAGIGQFVKQHRLDELGLTFTTAAGVHSRPLAEFVLWAVLAFTKNYPLARRQQREHLWQRFHNDDLEGKTLAVVGLGSIGTEVAKLAQRLNLRVIGSKHHIEGFTPKDLGVAKLYPHTAFKEMLPEADFVCLICPHTPATEGMMDKAAFAAMKPGSVLINIGRGALVQEDALLEALKHGPMQGAVLDVAPQEPLPETHPLWDMENVILFPHSASTSRQENRRLTELFCDNLRRYLSREPLRNVFVYDRLY